MASPLVENVMKLASSQGAQGRVNLARVGLKLGKKLEQATPSDDEKIRQLVKEIFGVQV